jgi:hypothetical protein
MALHEMVSGFVVEGAHDEAGSFLALDLSRPRPIAIRPTDLVAGLEHNTHSQELAAIP